VALFSRKIQEIDTMSARRFVAVLLVLMVGAVVIASAQTDTVYNSIPKPLPPNVASEGPEAYGFTELGDAVQLTATTGTIGQVMFVMSSWACQSGSWYQANCVTTAGATFSQPLTINVYSVKTDALAVDQLLGSITQTFNIPYRPSTDSRCSDGRWFNSKEKACYNGIAVPLTVNFSGMHVAVPSNGKVIVTVAFNSTHYGNPPMGESAACYGSGGCPYDSLNISTDTRDGIFTGGPINVNGIFVNYSFANNSNSCTGTNGTGLALDMAEGCWVGYHPEFQVQVNTNNPPKKKGNPA
jgi:hypothetical protein